MAERWATRLCSSGVWHPLTQLRTGGFWWSTILLPAYTCWWQLVHSSKGDDAKVLLSGITYIIFRPYITQSPYRKYVHITTRNVWNTTLEEFIWHTVSTHVCKSVYCYRYESTEYCDLDFRLQYAYDNEKFMTYCWSSKCQLLKTGYVSLFRLHGWMLFLGDECFERRDQLEIRRRCNVCMTTKNKEKSAQTMFEKAKIPLHWTYSKPD